jgi:hypothetical protein
LRFAGTIAAQGCPGPDSSGYGTGEVDADKGWYGRAGVPVLAGDAVDGE